jgi:hypothetical protein
MTTKDGFRLVPADRAEKPEQPASATAWRQESRRELIKAGILGATVAAIALAVLSVGNPSVIVTNATAFIATLTAPQDNKVEDVPLAQSSVEIQSSAGVQTSAEAQASPPAASAPMTSEPKASEAPPDNGLAAPVKTADQSQPDAGQASTENLLGRFQAWAARDNAQAEAQPAQPAPVQPVAAQPAQETQAESVQADAAAGPVQDALAEVEPVPNHRTIRRVKHARAEIRPKRDQVEDYKQAQKQAHRAKLRREQDARLLIRPAQDVREQERPVVQTTRAPSFLESLGLHE